MFNFMVKIRILPLTIFAGVLMLTIKVGDVVSPLKATLAVNKVQAQSNQPTPLLPDPSAPPAPAAKGAPPAKGATKGGAAADAAPTPPPTQTALADPANDPTLFTQNEIDLLQQLAERREEIEKKNQEMTVRGAMLQAAEKRIDSKIGELRDLQKAIDVLVKKHDEQEEQRIQSLVKIYENMKPKDAARIFNDLPDDVLVPVARDMKSDQLALVLASMNAENAKALTIKLANRLVLPQATPAAPVATAPQGPAATAPVPAAAKAPVAGQSQATPKT